MIRIANWAQKHVAASRLLIAILHVTVFFLAVNLSQLLTIANIQLPLYLLLSTAVIGASVVLFLGKEKGKRADRVQWRRIQKYRFFLTGLVCTFLLTGMLQHSSLQNEVTLPVQAAFTKAEEKKMPLYEDYTDKKAFWNDVKAYYHSLSKKELRKVLVYQTRHLSKISDNLEVAIGILLIGFAAATALLLIAGLACSLSCNGQGALAFLVLIGGWGLIIFLLVLLGKAYRKSKRKKAEEAKTTPSVQTQPTQ